MEVSQAVKESILQLGAKRVMFEQASETLETIVLGSSHGDYAFDPAYVPNSFNLCYRSLDLKHCYSLYQRTITACPNLKNLVLFYSVFSPGSMLERSPNEGEIGPLFSALFDLEVEYQSEHLTKLAQALTQQLQEGMAATLIEEAAKLDGHAGFMPNYKGAVPASEFKTRLLSHIKHNYESGADYYLLKILALANRLGHAVTIVIPPVSSAYRNALNTRSSVLFRELIEVVDLFPWTVPIKVLNAYDDEAYEDSFFVDSDHLDARGEGTRMLSRAIAAMVAGSEAAA
ncbi:hypothetical protein ASD21_12975 [Caulobacter sp. Root1455]|uniref:hypothetical protein n=1 Tax=Caulobacter sp. Root1455 TaxID=1736465 RepID=UPI0006F41349|nr:hypothetical protein [Caulobacter sp. Root1455]KQY92325.1 hypothetical protein ASD21_12975 [Caulobacter sp. Root1455]